MRNVGAGAPAWKEAVGTMEVGGKSGVHLHCASQGNTGDGRKTLRGCREIRSCGKTYDKRSVTGADWAEETGEKREGEKKWIK